MARNLKPDSAPSATRKPGGELALIEQIRRQGGTIRNREVRLGIGDDCAILRPRSGDEIVVTTDFCLEGRHFRRDWHSPASVGHRTLARGLSDLAAMGARPLAAFLSLALPAPSEEGSAGQTWRTGFLDGFDALADEAKITLAGGDTSQAPGRHILADITLLGAVPAGTALRRSGARPGDRLFCSGHLGGASAELLNLEQAPLGQFEARRPPKPSSDPNPHPQLFPAPRLRVGEALRKRKLASAAMDLSDGLSTDLTHLCEASQVAAEIDLVRLPIHPLAKVLGEKRASDLALHGGEDYELLFTVPSGLAVPKTIDGIRLTEIGRIIQAKSEQPTISSLSPKGDCSPLLPGGWEHLT